VKVIIFGATGMVGQGVLRESLLAADVTEILVVGRSPLDRASPAVQHPKLREVIHADFADLTPIEAELAGYDACFFCLGVSAVGLSEADYTRITYDFTMAAARPLARLNPDMTFIYVSGASTNPEGRAMWARVKGRTENAVLQLFPNGYAFRPGFIQPMHGVTSKTRLYRIGYAITTPLFPVLERLFPKQVTTNERLGRAMLRVARDGAPHRVVENSELR
jgi:uncharacterized protein YbjT (DUF2867 family)